MRRALRISLLYFALGIAWILASDVLGLYASAADVQQYLSISLFKGLSFVGITAVILYLLLRRHEDYLSESASNYRRLFMANPNPMAIYGQEDGIIRQANPAFLQLYGFGEADLEHKNIFDIIGPEDRDRAEQLVRSAGQKAILNHVLLHRKKDGTLFHVESFGHQVVFEGEPCRWVMLIDVEARARAADENLRLTEELKRSQNYFRSLLDSQSNYLVRVDMQGRYRFVNSAYAHSVGLDAGEVQGQDLFKDDIVPEDLERCEKAIFELMLRPEQVLRIDARLRNRQDGHIIAAEWECTGVADEAGKAIEIQAVGRDVTEKQAYYQALQHQKREMEHILGALNDVVWSCEATSADLRFISPGILKLSAYSAEELLAQPDRWQALVHPSDRERFWQAWQDLETQGLVQVEYRILRRDGQSVFVSSKMSLTRDAEGRPHLVNGATQDISRTKAAEAALEAQHRTLSDILNSLSDVFFTLDARDCFRYANGAFLDFFDQDENIIGKHISTCFADWPKNPLRGIYETVKQQGHSQQYEYYSPSRATWHEVTFYAAEHGVSVYWQDITERKVMQLAIENAEKNLSAVTNNTPDVIFSYDLNGHLLSLNDTFATWIKQVTGEDYRVGDMFPVKIFRYADAYVDYLPLMGRVIKGEHVRTGVTFRVPQLHGGERHYEVSLYPIWEKQQLVAGIGCIARDITARVRFEQTIQRQNEQLRQIAFFQSHEVRRPVSNIIQLLDMLQDPEEAELQDQLLGFLKSEIEALDEVVRRIVDMSNAVEALSSSPSNKEVYRD